LTGANLCAELEGANLTGVNLTGTCLVGTYMNQLAIADVSKTQSNQKQQPHDASKGCDQRSNPVRNLTRIFHQLPYVDNVVAPDQTGMEANR